MKADALTLAATLNSSEVDIYTIPHYQRPYTWDTHNFEVLWEDLTDAYKEYINAKKEEQTPEYYFLGPVVFVKNTVKRSFDIIDGQQRTTTFHVMLWYLYRKVEDKTEKARLLQILLFLNSETKLKVSSKDAATYLKIIETGEKIEGTSKMAGCANFFSDKINSLKDPEKFSEFLRDYTQFIVIVADDYAKAWDLFIGLNGKGEPLNPTDLVKAYVCGSSDIGDDAGIIWEEKILPLKEDSTPYLLFLSRYKSKKYIAENNLFREIQNLFPKSLSLLDISEFSRVFHLFWHVPINEIANYYKEKITLTLDAKKSLRILRELGRRDFTTLLFQYAEAFGERSIFDERLLKLLTSFQIRMAIGRKRSRERKFVAWFKDFEFISKPNEDETRSYDEIFLDDKMRSLGFISQVLKYDAPDDNAFETEIRLSDYGNNTARIILRHYEEGDRGNKQIDDFQLEHLMPQTGTVDHWYIKANVIDENGDVDEIKYSNIVNNIGNLFVIDSTTNNEVKNYDYDVKKKFYQEHLKDWSIARITADKHEWIPEDITGRANTIADWAKNYWKI